MIDTNLPLMLAREEMERLGIILHLDRDEIELHGKRGSQLSNNGRNTGRTRTTMRRRLKQQEPKEERNPQEAPLRLDGSSCGKRNP